MKETFIKLRQSGVLFILYMIVVVMGLGALGEWNKSVNPHHYEVVDNG